VIVLTLRDLAPHRHAVLGAGAVKHLDAEVVSRGTAKPGDA
jgi:hypothetical protein